MKYTYARRTIIVTVLSVIILMYISTDIISGKKSVLSNNNSRLKDKLNDIINPNFASWESLARIPGIARGKATEIIRYRENYINTNMGLPFTCAEDMQNVRGIGPATIQNIKPYLHFAEEQNKGVNK